MKKKILIGGTLLGIGVIIFAIVRNSALNEYEKKKWTDLFNEIPVLVNDEKLVAYGFSRAVSFDNGRAFPIWRLELEKQNLLGLPLFIRIKEIEITRERSSPDIEPSRPKRKTVDNDVIFYSTSLYKKALCLYNLAQKIDAQREKEYLRHKREMRWKEPPL